MDWQPIDGEEPKAANGPSQTPSSPSNTTPKIKPFVEKDHTEDASQTASFDSGWGAAEDKLWGAVDAADAKYQAYVSDLQGCGDVDKQVSQLAPGDSCSFKAKVDGGAKFVGGEEERSATVERDEHGYTVRLDADNSVLAQFGLKGTPVGGGEVKAGVKVGHGVELHYATKEEAEAAVKIFAKQCGAQTLDQAAFAGMPLGVAEHLVGPSNDERALLERGKKADEFDLAGVASFETDVGPEVESIKAKLLKVGMDVSASSSVRVEYDKEGQPTDMVITRKMKFGGEAAVGLFGDNSGSMNAGKHEGEISVEQRYSLPKGVTLDGHDGDPIEFLAAYAHQIRPEGEPKLKMAYSGDLPGGKRLKGQIEVSANPEQIAKSDAFGKFLDGDFGAAAKEFASRYDATGSVKTYDVSSHNVGLNLKIGGVGAGVSMESEREHLTSTMPIGADKPQRAE